jgi:hypothetical protein
MRRMKPVAPLKIVAPLTRAAMSKTATNNAVLIALRDVKKLLRQLLAATQKQSDPNASLTPQEFRAAEKISKTTFHKMLNEGRGPDLIYPVDGSPRITADARRRWQEAREAEAKAQAAE